MDELALVALIAILAGLVKGISGFGSSLVTIPLLRIVYGINRLDEIVIMMITFNVLLNFLLLFESKGFSLKSIKKVYLLTGTGVVFTFIGLSLLEYLDKTIISNVAAGLILIAVFVQVYKLYVKNPITLKPYKWLQVIVGAFSGLGNGIASVDGPPVVFYMTSINADKVTFKNTLAAHFLVMGIMGVTIMILRGMYTETIIINSMYFMLFSSIGLGIGMVMSKKMNESIFQKVILVILVFLAIRMMFL